MSTGRKTPCVVGVAAALVVLSSGPPMALAQSQSSLERFNRQLDLIRRDNEVQIPRDVPVGQRALLDYGGYFIFDYLSVDDNLEEEHILRQYDTTLYARLNVDGAHELFLRFRANYLDFHSGDSFDGEGDEWDHPDFDRAYYRFDLQRAMRVYHDKEIDQNLIVQVGRDLVYWGNGLTLGQELDGLTLNYSDGPAAIDLIAGITPKHTVDFDSSRPDFDDNTRRGFYGAMASVKVGQHRPYAYALAQRDYNDDDPLVSPPTTTEFNYNSYYLGIGTGGALTDRFLYGVEAVFEGGSTLSNSFEVNPPFIAGVPQTRDNIRAFAFDARLDYLFADPRRTRLSGEFVYATGDDDRALNSSTTFGGNTSGTRDRAFNGFGIINTGLAFAPAVSNLVMIRGGVSTFPFPDVPTFRRMQVGADVYVFGKASHGAPIDEPSLDETYLGWEPDFFMNWQVVSDVTLALRYGVFVPSSDAFPSDKLRQFFSTSLTFAF